MEDDGEDYSRVSFAESYSAEDDDFMGHSATAGRGQNNDAKATVRYHPTTCLPARVVSLTLRPVCVCVCVCVWLRDAGMRTVCSRVWRQ